VRRLVEEVVSVPELARGTLGGRWAQATPAQRQQFQELLRELIVQRVAAGRLLACTPSGEPRAVFHGDDEADVTAAVVRAGEPPDHEVAMVYRLRRAGSRWQIYDLVVDGNSLSDAYHTEFDRIIARESFDGLFTLMRRRLDRGA
jgi:ABC-type transporter MlaC component